MSALESRLIAQNRALLEELQRVRASLREAHRQLASKIGDEKAAFDRGYAAGRSWAEIERGRS